MYKAFVSKSLHLENFQLKGTVKVKDFIFAISSTPKLFYCIHINCIYVVEIIFNGDFLQNLINNYSKPIMKGTRISLLKGTIKCKNQPNMERPNKAYSVALLKIVNKNARRFRIFFW